MFVWGKVCGALFGFLLIGDGLFSSLSGIVIGLFAGYFFDYSVAKKYKDKNALHWRNLNHQERQEFFFDCTFSVMGCIAKAKEQVTTTDIQVANVYLDLIYVHSENPVESELYLLNALQTTKHRMNVRRAFTEGQNSELLNALQVTKHRMQANTAFAAGKKMSFSLKQKLLKFTQVIGDDRYALQIFLGIQIQLVYNEGELTNKKKNALGAIGADLGFSPFEVNRLLRMLGEQQPFYQGKQSPISEDEPYSILGLNKTASDKEIKIAYRKLMSQYHPDKLVSKGLSDEMMQEAKEMTLHIQQAYQSLRRS